MTDYTKLDAYGPLKLRNGAGGAYENGLCVMEAVAWMADEGATDTPDCACPVLGKFAVRLNDRLNDSNRQELRRLILPMTGTRSPKHEVERATYITLRVAQEIVSIAYDKIGLAEHAEAFRNVTTLVELRAVAIRANADAASAAAADADADAAYAAEAAAYAAYADAADAADAAAYAADAADAADADADAWQGTLLKCIPILEGAIALGPNAKDQWPEYKARADALAKFADEVLAEA